ncbi:hypothetical protein Tco_0185810 [Tanacetum coccineum]
MSSRGLVYLETYILFIDKYGYIKNHKKTVKNEQARTREPEEYKAEARKAKPQSKSAKGIEREGLKVQICQSPITRMTLELANRSITHPMGIAEDVVVKVDGFITFQCRLGGVSSSPMKTSDNFEKFSDELAPLGSLPPGNDDSTFKKDFHEVNFQVYSNTLFEFDDNFKSGNVNPLFEEHDKVIGRD